MKLLPVLLLLFVAYSSYSQEEEFQIEARIVGINGKPIADAYIINFRNLDKNVSKLNGVINMWVLPSDSLVISHISYFRKTVTVHALLINPIIQLELDTIAIKDINVFSRQKTDSEKAAENIESIQFDFRPQPRDSYTESERMQLLLNTENRVQRTAAYSVNLLRFSPSEQIGKLFKKMKKRKKSRQYKSTRKKQ